MTCTILRVDTLAVPVSVMNGSHPEWDSRARQKIREAIVLDEDAGHTIDCFDNREFLSVGRSQHYR